MGYGCPCRSHEEVKIMKDSLQKERFGGKGAESSERRRRPSRTAPQSRHPKQGLSRPFFVFIFASGLFPPLSAIGAFQKNDGQFLFQVPKLVRPYISAYLDYTARYYACWGNVRFFLIWDCLEGSQGIRPSVDIFRSCFEFCR